MRPRVIGYGICGGGESDRYLAATLDEFKRLCDDTVILGNKLKEKDRALIEEYGFSIVDDDREWGKNQHKIKEDFVRDHVSKLDPDICVCLDMDEVFANVEREDIEKAFKTNDAFYVYVVNLWDEGYRKDWSFWNVRMWAWKPEKYSTAFLKWENRPLHCGLAPKWTYALNIHAPFVLEHYGLKERADRQKKIKRYKQYDPKAIYREPSYYKALDTDWSDSYNRKSVVKLVTEHIDSIKQPLHKKTMLMKENHGKEVKVIREADGLIFTEQEKFLPALLKRKFKGKGFIVLEDKKVAPKEEVKEEVKEEKKVAKKVVKKAVKKVAKKVAKKAPKE